MVSRRPVPSSADASLAPVSAPPYPVTPITLDAPGHYRPGDLRDELRAGELEQEDSEIWSREKLDRLAGGDTGHKEDIPAALRPGPPGYTPKGSHEMLKPDAASTNPYTQKTQGADDGRESSASAWGGLPGGPAQPLEAPPPPPISMHTPPPTEQSLNLSVFEPSNNPWQPALDTAAPSNKASPLPSLHRQDSGNEAWSAPLPARQAPTVPEHQPVLVDIDEPESPAWDEDEPDSPIVQEMPATPLETHHLAQDTHAWDDSRGNIQPQAPVQSHLLAPEDSAQQGEGCNMVHHEGQGQYSGVIAADGEVLERFHDEEPGPALPPRRSQEQPPVQPPRPFVDTANTSTSSISSATAAAVRTQKKETYEIKKITWHDVTAAQNPRVSPILVQNANGPCPLLALVNALTLSTPPNVETALVDTLRSREQVSLGLLLDAVIDELMSGRRCDPAQDLPDIDDLYRFLLALHTGMNVNPRFSPAPPSKSGADPRNSMQHIHPTEREAAVPGTFEDTREMKLYASFSIPLIHGWLPETGSPAYTALRRSANSYEDAQNLMFREEELEDKLLREGLNFEEQATLEDIATIKAFFVTAATQLTSYGLDTITNSLTPGAVAILFRNDHFSTLYRHPDTLQLLQLVTDLGYVGHEEVIWESLIDVNGENAEFLSGDFRLVGGAPASPSVGIVRPQAQSNDGRTTVPVRNQHQRRQNESGPSNQAPPQGPPQSLTEQEDHDFALALQLQEEEEERQRAEMARRKREADLSEEFIEQQGRQGQASNSVPVPQRGGAVLGNGRGRTASIPIRGGASSGSNTEARPEIPPRRNGAGGQPIDPEAGVDVPPPTYEQAANAPAYAPPANHPANPYSSPNPQRRMSAYTTNSQTIGNSPVGRGSRRTAVDGRSTRGGLTQQQQDERSKDCIVM